MVGQTMSNIYFKIIYVLFYFIFNFNFFLGVGGVFGEFSYHGNQKQKKSSKQHGTKDFFWERKGKSHHVWREKKG